MNLFEVFLVPGGDASQLLSAEILEETGAQIMTPEEAELVGLQGLPEDPQGRLRKSIACSPSDERLVASRLEAHAAVGSFRLHTL